MLIAACPRLLIDKHAQRLHLTTATSEQSFPVALGRNAAADKMTEGDLATPLGDFYVCAKNPRSRFFLSLCLSYPNMAAAERGLRAGLITIKEHLEIVEAIRRGGMPPQYTRLGGEIYVHGHAPGSAPSLVTRGCIALENSAMQLVYDIAAIGTRVHIV